MSQQSPKLNPLGDLIDMAFYIYHQLADTPLDYKVQQVLDGTNLVNHFDQPPKILERRPTKSGMQIVFTLPPGLDTKDFESRRLAIEQQTGTIVKIEPGEHGAVVIMTLFKAKFPEKIPYAFNPADYPEMMAPLPIGVDPAGKLVVVDLAEVYHMLVGGVTGYGKTSELFVFVVSLLLAGCEVSAIDKKAIDFPLLGDYIEVAQDEESALRMLKAHLKEKENRSAQLREAKVQKIQKMKGQMVYKVLIMDEATGIENEESHGIIQTLVREARAGGIGLIITTQKPSANTWKGFTDVRSNLAGRVCFYCNGDANDSQVILGKGNSRGAELPAIPGRCVWHWKTEEVLQSMFLDADTAIQILEANKIPKRGAESIANTRKAPIPT
ncbi:MAG: FtsK/SpoIIIE domain-containing protein [Desulfitobacterium sp.]